MIRAGITGNIGSGKSIITKIFAVLGIPVYYADVQASVLMNKNEEVKEKLKKLFGNEIYNEFGGLNKKKLASLIFSDDAARKNVNAIVHPAVAHDFEEWYSMQDAPYIIKEAALLFESGSNIQLDKIICVTAPLNLRIQRVTQRDERSEVQIRSIDAKQMSEAEKMKRSDYIICNDETIPVIPQVIIIHKKLLEVRQPTKDS